MTIIGLIQVAEITKHLLHLQIQFFVSASNNKCSLQFLVLHIILKYVVVK